MEVGKPDREVEVPEQTPWEEPLVIPDSWPEVAPAELPEPSTVPEEAPVETPAK